MEARRCPACATARRATAILAVALAPMLAGASHRTANFTVEAPTPEVARQVADRAEVCRVAVARAWLGKDLPPWPVPCPVRVKITRGEAGGITNFGFAGGRVTDQEISVEGRLDRILASGLPHEVTHTVFAAYFGAPMPRWADEGASLLSEDGLEHRRHDRIVVDVLARRLRGRRRIVRGVLSVDDPDQATGDEQAGEPGGQASRRCGHASPPWLWHLGAGESRLHSAVTARPPPPSRPPHSPPRERPQPRR